MTRDLLPLDRPLNEDELRGFRIACDCLETWGHQIKRQGVSLGGTPRMVPVTRMMEHGGHMVAACAKALGQTLGSHQRVAVNIEPDF